MQDTTVTQRTDIQPPAGFDPDAEFVNLSRERYTKVPKSSHREGEHRLGSLLALGVLTYYLSHRTGWKIESAEKLATQWGEGAGRIREAVKDIERAGFLVRFRRQGPDGKWRTQTYVSSDPETLQQARDYAAWLAATANGKVTGSSTDATNAEGDGSLFPQVAPDAGYRDSVDRVSVDRASVDRVPVTGDLKNVEDHQEDQEKKIQPRSLASLGTGSATSDTEPTPRQRAFGIARGWIEHRRAKALPIVARGRNGALHTLRSLLEPFIGAGYSDDELKRALADIAEGIPSAAQLERTLVARRSGTPPVRAGGRNTGANRHVDELTQAQRDAINPFFGAARSSQVHAQSTGGAA